MHTILGLFDPGWRDFTVRNAVTEIIILLILAALIGAVLYHFIIGRKKKIPAEWENRYIELEKELQEEKSKHHKIKTQLEAAVAKANSFSSASHELDKIKSRLHDLQKDLDHTKADNEKLQGDLRAEHAKITSLVVDHGEVEELKNRIRNQEKELNTAKSEAERFRTEFEKAVSEKTRLSASLEESRVNELKSKLSKLENDLHSSRMLVAKYQSEAKVVEDEKKRLAEESNQWEQQKSETGNLQSKLSAAEKELQKSRQSLAELAGLRTQVEALTKEKENWENEANSQAKLASEAVSLKQQFESLQKENETLKAAASKAAASGEDLIKLRAETGQLKSHLSLLESDLVVARQSYKELEQRYEQISAGQKETVPALDSENGKNIASETMISEKDDLKQIEGIGPKTEELFFNNGIRTYAQLASASAEKLNAILEKGGETFRIHDPATWPQQAKLLQEGRTEEFEKLTKELKGGRKPE